MSDMPEQRKPQPVPKKIRFIVDCDMEIGQVQIQGPIQHKMLAVKILADAIHIVTDYQPPVIAPAGSNGNGHLLVPGMPDIRTQ